jgi:hypothetical protein
MGGGETMTLARPMDVDCAVDGDPAKPEKNTAVMVFKSLNPLQGRPKCILQHILCSLWHRQFWQNHAPVKRIGKPLEQDACGLSIPSTNSRNNSTLLIERRKVVMGRVGHQAAPHAHPNNGVAAPVLHNRWRFDAAIERPR